MAGLLDLALHLAEWAPRINLTGHKGPVAIVERLILDAVALEGVLPPAATIVDLGSGAGFPGLPLALLRPHARVLLVEAREKRHHFQRATIRRGGLANVRALRGRIETLAPEPCELVVAQAVASPADAVPLALPWCTGDGWIAIPGGSTPRATALDPDLEGEIAAVETRRYRVPAGSAHAGSGSGGRVRTVWLGRRGVAAESAGR